MGSVTVDQRYKAPDENLGGADWERLGVFTGSASYKVKLGTSANGRVIADAVRILEVGPTVKHKYEIVKDAFGVVIGQKRTVTDARGNSTIYDHDKHGRLTTVTYPNADGKGSPTTSTVYYDDGSVKEQIDPLGNKTRYEYDELGRTIKVTAPDPDDFTSSGGSNGPLNSPITLYTYNASGEMTSMTETFAGDTLPRTTRYEYDALGRQTHVILPIADPAVTPFDKITDDDTASYPLGTWTEDNAATGSYNGDQHYTSNTSLTAQWSIGGLEVGKSYEVYATWKPDSLNAVDSRYEVYDGKVDPASREVSTYVNQRLVPSDRVDGATSWERLAVFKADNSTVIVQLGGATASGRVVADAARVVEVGAVTKTGYNEAGNAVSTVDALGNLTISAYDNRDRLAAVYQASPNPSVPAFKSNVTDNQPSTYGWLTIQDPRAYGASYLRAYLTDADDTFMDVSVPASSAGRTFAVLATWVPDPNNISGALFRAEDDQRNVLSVPISVDQKVDPADWQDETGRWWGVVTTFTLPSSPSFTRVLIAGTVAFEGGTTLGAQADAVRLIEVGPGTLKFTYNAAGEMTSSLDARGQTTSYQYDLLGRQKTVTLPDPDGGGAGISPQTEFVYDKVGNVLQEKVRLTATPTYLTTYHSYDRLNRREVTTDANFASTTFKYDANGNLIQLNDPQTPYSPAGGNPTYFAYDALNRLTTETNVFGAARTFEYDKASRMTKHTNRDGRKIKHIYDNLGRQTAEQFLSASEAIERTLSLTYDNQGRLQSASDPAATYTYSYDTLGEVLQTTATIAGLTPSVTTNEVSDILGRRTELRATVGAGADFKNNYTLDNLGRVAKITQQGQGGNTVADKRVEYAYNSASEVTNVFRHRHPTSSALVMQTNYLRDNVGRVTSLAHVTSSGATFAAYTSVYDAASRLTSSSRSTNGGSPATESATYNYDNTGQLTGGSRVINGVATFPSYSYDANGNRTAANGVTFTPTLNNRIYRDGTFEYEYDAEGNITRRKLISNNIQSTYYSYDQRNRLVAVSDFNAAGANTQNVVYTYDVFNRRVVKSVDPDGGGNGFGQPYTPTYFVYDSDDVVLALAAGGGLQNRYLHGPAVDEVLADERPSGTVLWDLRDQFYNVRDLVDSFSSHYNHYDYDAFGTVFSQWNNGLNLTHAYGFQSRERDQETGENFHRNRYYGPSIARWRSEDPIGFGGGDVNLNRFVRNAPTIQIDPNGLFEISIGFNAFIPKSKGRVVLGMGAVDPRVADVNWGIEPGQVYWDTPYMFATDNRERAGSPGTSRVVLRGSFDSLDIGQLEPLKPIFRATAGESHQIQATVGDSPFGPQYVAGSFTTERARARTVERLADYSSSRSGITAGASAAYPFSSVGPSIDYGFSGDVCRLKDGSVLFRFVGDHNEFPAYEIIINGALIYNYRPTAPGPDPINLNSSERFNIKVLIKPDGSVQRQDN